MSVLVSCLRCGGDAKAKALEDNACGCRGAYEAVGRIGDRLVAERDEAEARKWRVEAAQLRAWAAS